MAGDSENQVTWPSEDIGDNETLYMRIHESNIEQGEVMPGAFKNHGDGMSTDWSKYSTPTQTRMRAKEPARNGVIQMKAGAVRQIPGQSVKHTPIYEPPNRAHTDVFGDKKKDPEVRVCFKRIYSWAIKMDSPVG